jgi:hypothetical protein
MGSRGALRGRRRESAQCPRGRIGRFWPGNGGDKSRLGSDWRDGICEGEEPHCQGAAFFSARVGSHVLRVYSLEALVDGGEGIRVICPDEMASKGSSTIQPKGVPAEVGWIQP